MRNSFERNLPSCSALSIEVNEQLYGTAPLTEGWIALEYPIPFGRKALEDSAIPEAVKAYFIKIQKSIPATRLLLIRQETSVPPSAISLFVGLSSIQPPRLYEFHLSNYEELLDLDLASLLSGRAKRLENLRDKPLFLVCTNGKRDPCCARWGLSVYSTMANHAADLVWQTSHLGGHRFAANVICLPHGIYYGRIRPEQAISLMIDYHTNRLTPQSYRGRAQYSPEVQAAEYFLLANTSLVDVDAFQLRQSHQTAPNHWEVCFNSRGDGSQYSLEVTAINSAFSNYESCSTPEKRSPRLQYQLERWSKS
jgi:hypothetical protein